MNHSNIICFEKEKRKARISRYKMRISHVAYRGSFILFIFAAYMISLERDLLLSTARIQTPEIESVVGNIHTVAFTPDSRGHYMFFGEINGIRVKFMYDTGATGVAIPNSLASDLGLVRGQPYYASTANGEAKSYHTVLEKVKVGSIEIANVKGGIVKGLEGDEILLGMSFLEHLEIFQTKDSLKFVYHN